MVKDDKKEPELSGWAKELMIGTTGILATSALPGKADWDAGTEAFARDTARSIGKKDASFADRYLGTFKPDGMSTAVLASKYFTVERDTVMHALAIKQRSDGKVCKRIGYETLERLSETEAIDYVAALLAEMDAKWSSDRTPCPAPGAKEGDTRVISTGGVEIFKNGHWTTVLGPSAREAMSKPKGAAVPDVGSNIDDPSIIGSW